MKVRLGELRQVIRNVVSEGAEVNLPPGTVSGPGERGGWTVELRGFAVTKPTQEEAEAAFAQHWPMMAEYFPEPAPRKPVAPAGSAKPYNPTAGWSEEDFVRGGPENTRAGRGLGS
jgi:hypothetical protein